MNELALANIQNLSPRQLKIISAENDKQRIADVAMKFVDAGGQILKPALQFPYIPIILGWLLIEQLNNHQAFGTTQEKSDASSSQLAAILLATGIIDAIVPG
jgi:hypothetical protein